MLQAGRDRLLDIELTESLLYLEQRAPCARLCTGEAYKITV